jgi:AraC family transcriptional regulator of adaptative response/methylated-DNA-[protein]-cysteine methyltransferase
MQLTLTEYPAPLATLLMVTDADGTLRALDYADFEERMRRLLARHYDRFELVRGPAPTALIAALEAYFSGDLVALDAVRVATGGSAFQRSVWAALRPITPGRTTSYGALAAALGNPGASRSVGLASSANPVGIVVPCHRVIGVSGAFTGYAGGIERKRWLLAHEGATGEAKRDVFNTALTAQHRGSR